MSERTSYWPVYFTAPDADAALATAGSAGGQVLSGPIDIPVGRLAVLRDPHGAMFAVMAPTDEIRNAAP